MVFQVHQECRVNVRLSVSGSYINDRTRPRRLIPSQNGVRRGFWSSSTIWGALLMKRTGSFSRVVNSLCDCFLVTLVPMMHCCKIFRTLHLVCVFTKCFTTYQTQITRSDILKLNQASEFLVVMNEPRRRTWKLSRLFLESLTNSFPSQEATFSPAIQ